MTPTRTCLRCGRVSQAAHSYCPACGESLKTSGGGHGWKLLVGALLLFAGVLWATALTHKRPSLPHARNCWRAMAPRQRPPAGRQS